MTASFYLPGKTAIMRYARPLSSFVAADFAVGAAYEPTTGNFPALMSFFQFNETGGNNCYDYVSKSGYFTAAAGFSRNYVTGYITALTPGPTAAVSSSGIPANGFGPNGNPVLFTVSRNAPAVGMIDFLRCSGLNIPRSSDSTRNLATDNIGNNLSLTMTGANHPALTGTSQVGEAVAVQRTGGNAVASYYRSDKGLLGSSAPGPLSSFSSTLTSPIVFKQGAGGAAYFGLALFSFASPIPSDLPQAIAWMAYQWQLGNKWLWPYWKGIV